MQNDLRYELQNVLSGKSQISFGTTIQAIANYLKNGETTSPSIEITKHFKSEETQRLESYIILNNLWAKDINLSQYVSEGAEQKVNVLTRNEVLYFIDTVFFLTKKFWMK